LGSWDKFKGCFKSLNHNDGLEKRLVGYHYWLDW